MSAQALLCIPDARLRSLFSLLLTDGDAQVTACHDSEEFQSVLVTRFYDLCAITLDASTDPAGLVKAVRYHSPETRILLIANKDDVEQIIPLFPLGLSEVLLQPINPKKAITAIQRMLSSSRADTPAEAVAEAGTEGTGTSPNMAYRPQHVVARSEAMRTVVNRLWAARLESLGVILRGEPGSEFELIAREYQAMCGDPNGYLHVLSHSEVTSEGLATAASLDRLNDGIPRTFFIRDLELLPAPQQAQLLDFLRLAKRRKDRERPLRFVFTAAECDDNGRNLELPFIEELLFVLPVVVTLPPLRERKADIEPLARKILLELTAIHPEYRVRSIKPVVTDWLAGRLWRGNYDEFCSYLRRLIAECPSRELTMAYMTTRDMAFRGNDTHVDAPQLTATTSMSTTVATTVPAKDQSTPHFGEQRPAVRRTAKELLALVR